MTVRFAPLPPTVIFPFGTRVVFDEVAVTVKSAANVSTSPTVKGMAPVEVSSFVDLSVMLLIVGRSFTAVTVTLRLKMLLSVKPSLTLTGTVNTPLKLAAGVIVFPTRV